MEIDTWSGWLRQVDADCRDVVVHRGREAIDLHPTVVAAFRVHVLTSLTFWKHYKHLSFQENSFKYMIKPHYRETEKEGK